MAQAAFHRGTQFAERAVIFGNQEVRVVAKAVGAPGFANDASVAIGFDLQATSRRVGQGHVADVAGISPLRDGGQFVD